MRGEQACLNHGKCLPSSVCECTRGYNGVSCNECKQILKIFSKNSQTNFLNFSSFSKRLNLENVFKN
jgi:hypothetical protein